MIDEQRINTKYNLKYYLRDGLNKIMKSERENDYSIDPSYRCDRHDRYL